VADFLTAHLEAKGGEHSSLATLVNQWGFDVQLIPKALQTVGNMFPHYSRHDESHSKQILVNIERLLGDNIRLLTATDTWLILEAAYWHDIGMVVPQEDIIDACGQEAFRTYLEQIRLAPNHELNRFANSFDPHNLSVCFAGADTPFDAVDKFRQLMAEWFRQRHAGRAELVVQSPWTSAGISSPRTELMPNRLFRILGRICHMHGLPFSQVMSDAGLPFREAGLAREDCHPRFVACLLRMGDLLDLDDNRFCPVMQRIAGEHRPNSSKAHEDKHAGLRHLRVDQERIEISAECSTIDGYLETFRWFSWIQQELRDQMVRWQDIVPHRSLGLLPTLGDLSVSLSGAVQILAPGMRPQFSLDNEQAIALLQGANLYSSKFVCIRELLQNAVDATLMRLWLSKGSSPGSEEWSSPSSEQAHANLQSRPITVQIRELTAGPADGGKSKWEIVISDRGTGISREDLGYMLRIGGSLRNLKRQSVIRTMPEWMKPSGAFGIGFQSAFMVSPEVSLDTKSIYTNEILRVTLFSPTGPKEGLVLVELKPDDVARDPGTTVRMVIETESYASRFGGVDDKDTIASAFIQAVDPILDDRFPYEAAQLADQISNFSERSLIPIRGEMTTSDSSFTVGSAPPSPEPESALGAWNFLTIGDDALSLRFRPALSGFHPRAFETFYRGQPFESRGYFPYAYIGVDLMSGKAGAWLSASRDKLATNAESSLHELALRAVEQQVERELAHAHPGSSIMLESRPIYSRFLETMALSFSGKWSDLAGRMDRAWLDLTFAKPAETFRKFFDGEGGVVAAPPHFGTEDESETDCVVDFSGGDLMTQLVLKSWVAYMGGTVGVIEPRPVNEEPEVANVTGGRSNPMANVALNAKRFRTRYSLSKSAQPAYTPGALAARLASLVGRGFHNQRFLLNADDKWRGLWLRVPVSLRALPLFIVAAPTSKFVVLPFLFRGHARAVESNPAHLDKLSSWSLSRVEHSSSFSEIRKLYEELVKYIDDEVMGCSVYSARWQKARGFSE
jgi:hypothetical protein